MVIDGEIVLCTGNPGKLCELQMLMPSGLRLLDLSQVGLGNDLPETGDTLEANALQKARFAFAHCGKACLADDTGLEVTALGGAPGVYSARYAGEERDPLANMHRLLFELEGQADRSARFRTVLALVTSAGEQLFEGVVHGHIGIGPRGTGGFGYDPLFIPAGYDRTFAELERDVKNAISHRGKALATFLKALEAGGSDRAVATR